MNLDQKILQETIVIEGEVYTFDDLLGIGVDLNAEFKNQPGRYAYIAALVAKSEAVYNDAKHRTETEYAHLELDYRKTLAEEGVKVTEATIKSYVQTDDRYSASIASELNALQNWKLLRAIEAGLRERGQMLISIGANMRQEQSMLDMHINQAKDKLRELRK